MARCTAPVRGHRSSASAADCPACGGGRGYGYGGSYRSSYYDPPYSTSGIRGGTHSSGGGRSSDGVRPRWSRAGSSVSYTPSQVVSLTPIRESVEKTATEQPDLRDCFLCHTWDDRQGTAKDLYELLENSRR